MQFKLVVSMGHHMGADFVTTHQLELSTFQHPALHVTESVPIYTKTSAYALILCHKSFSLREEMRSLPNQQWLPEKVGFLRRTISRDMLDLCCMTTQKTYCSPLTPSLDS